MQPRAVIFLEKFPELNKDRFNTTEYIIWVTGKAREYKEEKGLIDVLDQNDFTEWLRREV